MNFKNTLHSKTLKFTIIIRACLMIFMFASTAFCPCSTPIGYAASAEHDQAPEYLVKAVYLFKFLSFVQWPDNEQPATIPDDKITIGILGDDPFGDHFQPIEGHVIKSMDKKIAIKRLGPYKDGINLKQCQLLFICSSEKERIKRILNRTKGTATLTVADIKGFLELGGMVNLVSISGLIRWEIDLSSIRREGLNVSATLVQSAVRVIHIPGPINKRKTVEMHASNPLNPVSGVQSMP